MSTLFQSFQWKAYTAMCDREVHAHVIVAQSLGKIDAEHAVRSIGQHARHSLVAWKKETSRGA